MSEAYWFTQHEQGGFRVRCAALGDADLSVMPLGHGRWSWLLRRDGADIAEGDGGQSRRGPAGR
jgi:hypothetical protein